MRFTFIDLFAGIGGFRKAFESIGGKCIFTSEYNKFCQETYKVNYDCNHPIVGDITKIKEEDIPAHDILCAGFPCQPFSLAGIPVKNHLGKPHGFKDLTQGTLFFDIVRIINYHKPKMFILENVKNLKSHDKGNTFKTIIGVLTNKLGYNVQWRVIDARHWLPQHRERIFIIGFRDETEFEFDNFIMQNETNFVLKDILEHTKVDKKYTISDRAWNGFLNHKQTQMDKGNGFGYKLVHPNEKTPTLTAHYARGGKRF